MDDCACALGHTACRIYIRADRAETSGTSPACAVDSVCDHDDLAPILVFRPTLHKINERKVGTTIRTSRSDWQPKCFGSLIVIPREVLSNLNRGIPHVPDAN